MDAEEMKPEFSKEIKDAFIEKELHKQHAQQCILEKGLKMHRKKGEDTVLKEIGQPHDRACFEPI